MDLVAVFQRITPGTKDVRSVGRRHVSPLSTGFRVWLPVPLPVEGDLRFSKRLRGEGPVMCLCFCSGPGSNQGRGQRRCVVLKTPEPPVSHLRIGQCHHGPKQTRGWVVVRRQILLPAIALHGGSMTSPGRESFNGQRCLCVAVGSSGEIVGREVPGVGLTTLAPSYGLGMPCFDLAFGGGGSVKKRKCKTNYCRYAELATRDVRIFIARTILRWIHGTTSTMFWTDLYIFSKSHCNMGGC